MPRADSCRVGWAEVPVPPPLPSHSLELRGCPTRSPGHRCGAFRLVLPPPRTMHYFGDKQGIAAVLSRHLRHPPLAPVAVRFGPCDALEPSACWRGVGSLAGLEKF